MYYICIIRLLKHPPGLLLSSKCGLILDLQSFENLVGLEIKNK